MSRTKGSKNKVKKTKVETIKVSKTRGRPSGSKNKKNEAIVNMVRSEDYGIEIKTFIPKTNKDLVEGERIEDNTMLDHTDVYIDEEDHHIGLDGHRTDSIICQYPTLKCKDCGILNKCEKPNKMVFK